MAAAAILTADELATKWIFCDGNALTVADISKYLQTKESVDMNLRAYNYMVEVVAGNKAKFESDSPEVWGKISDGYVYMISRNFNKLCEDGGFNAGALKSWMIQKGLSRTDKGKKIKTMRISGHIVKCVCFLLDESLKDEDGFEQCTQEELPF